MCWTSFLPHSRRTWGAPPPHLNPSEGGFRRNPERTWHRRCEDWSLTHPQKVSIHKAVRRVCPVWWQREGSDLSWDKPIYFHNFEGPKKLCLWSKCHPLEGCPWEALCREGWGDLLRKQTDYLKLEGCQQVGGRVIKIPRYFWGCLRISLHPDVSSEIFQSHKNWSYTF